MGITAQLCELLQVREIGLEIREEAPGGLSSTIVVVFGHGDVQ
jgi:hypothetical protein